MEQKEALAEHLGMSPSALHFAPKEVTAALSMTGGFHLDQVPVCSELECETPVREYGDRCPKVCVRAARTAGVPTVARRGVCAHQRGVWWCVWR